MRTWVDVFAFSFFLFFSKAGNKISLRGDSPRCWKVSRSSSGEETNGVTPAGAHWYNVTLTEYPS